jgi:hypothetical protein
MPQYIAETKQKIREVIGFLISRMKMSTHTDAEYWKKSYFLPIDSLMKGALQFSLSS